MERHFILLFSYWWTSGFLQFSVTFVFTFVHLVLELEKLNCALNTWLQNTLRNSEAIQSHRRAVFIMCTVLYVCMYGCVHVYVGRHAYVHTCMEIRIQRVVSYLLYTCFLRQCLTKPGVCGASETGWGQSVSNTSLRGPSASAPALCPSKLRLEMYAAVPAFYWVLGA